MKKCILLFLMAFLPIGLSARTGEWDVALDRYEAITVECIRLKHDLSSGKSVPASEVKRLAGELESLRTQLQGASGRMTAAQRARLADIRQMYFEGVPRSTAAVQFQPANMPAFLFADPPARAMSGSDSRVSLLCGRATHVAHTQPAQSSLRPFALVSAGIIPDLSFGLMAGALIRNHWGFYASARSNFVSAVHAYECGSDGKVPDGSIIWTTGKSKVSRLNMAAGALWHPISWASLYAGCGYGRRLLLWQDSSGEWAEVTDRSSTGVMFDAGLLVHYEKLVFNAGTSVIPGSTAYADISIGIGYSF